MDYEKKYKEALERAKQIYSTPYTAHWDVMKEVIEEIFTELRESEDERIRKAIIKHFRKEITADKYYGVDKEDIFAWLEKQGEQNPNYCHHEVDLSDCSEEYRKAYYDGWNNCNQQHAQLEAEQKPAEWSEEDESRMDNLCHFLEEYENQYYGHLTLQGTISWLKSLRPQNRWKPSEEQISVLNTVINYSANSEKPYWHDFIYNVLKDLKEQLKKM